MKNNAKKFLVPLISILVLVLFDQYTKHLAVIKLKGNNDFVLIKDVLSLHYLENKGAAFGILNNKIYFFIILSIIMFVCLTFVYYKIPNIKKFNFLKAIIIFIFSGAAGNFIDRVINGYVIDFVYFELINFPVFNVADIYITVSGFFLIILFLFYYNDDDFDTVFSFKRKDKNTIG